MHGLVHSQGVGGMEIADWVDGRLPGKSGQGANGRSGKGMRIVLTQGANNRQATEKKIFRIRNLRLLRFTTNKGIQG